MNITIKLNETDFFFKVMKKKGWCNFTFS